MGLRGPKPGPNSSAAKRARRMLNPKQRAKRFAKRNPDATDTFPSRVYKIRPGDVLNPNGVNQYSYRKTAEQTFDKILRGIDLDSGLPVAERILLNLVAMARNSDKWALDRVLERILPKPKDVDYEPGAGVTDDDKEKLAAALVGFVERRRLQEGRSGVKRAQKNKG